MSKTKHTAAPWRVGSFVPSSRIQIDCGPDWSLIIADVRFDDGEPEAEQSFSIRRIQ